MDLSIQPHKVYDKEQRSKYSCDAWLCHALILMAFIEVNKRILDYAQYREDVQVFLALFFEDILCYAKTVGMEQQCNGRESYEQQHLSLVNKHLDLEVKITVKKQHKELFI